MEGSDEGSFGSTKLHLWAGYAEHPGDAEFVGAHAEEGRPEGFVEGHLNAATGAELVEETLDFVGAGVGDGDLKAAKSGFAALGGVAAHERDGAERHGRVQDEVLAVGGTGAPAGASPKVMVKATLVLKVFS